MIREIDCRGMECPKPVLNAKKLIEEGGDEPFLIVVDNDAARDNVTRFAEKMGYGVEAKEKESGISLSISKKRGEAPGNIEPVVPACTIPLEDLVEKSHGKKDANNIVYINSRFVGVGDEKLGEILMKAFLKTLLEVEPRPSRAIFVNSGVFLTTEGSGVIETIRELEKSGISVFSCGTCLDFYNLKDKLKMGIVTNMLEIVESLTGADRIIKP